MHPYGNLSGNSGVVAYAIGSDFIEVKFADGVSYIYTHASAGRHNVERMKALARSGRGLSTFIVHNVRKAYASRSGTRS